MADIAKLVARLELQSSQFQAELEKTNRKLLGFQKQSTKSLTGIQRTAQNFSRNVSSSLAAAFSVYVSTRSLQGLVRITDQYTQLRGRLALVTDGTEELTRVQQELFQVAQRTRTEYSGVADLYIKLAQTGKELGASQSQLLAFTEGIGNALTVSGASAQGASGALLQLSQAMAAGTVRAEEYNSINEGAPEILRTVARNMDGMGGSISKLRAAVLAGEVSSREFFEAFLAGAEGLKEQAQAMPVTVGQAFTRLQNNINQAIAGADMSPLVDSITDLSEVVSDPAFQAGLSGVLTFLAKSANLLASVPKGFGVIGKELAQFAARITGNMSALDEVEDRLEEINRALKGGLDTPLRFAFTSDEELQRLKSELEKQRDAILEAWGLLRNEAASPASAKTGPGPAAERQFSPAVFDEAQIAASERVRRMLDVVDKGVRRLHEGTLKDVSSALGDLELDYKEATNELSVFSEEAARNMQDHFAEFLFDPFDDGLKGMAKGFLDTIRRMMAEAAAAKIFETLFKRDRSAGSAGGNALTSFLGSLFGARADGGPVSAGRPYVVGERGPELFMPGMSGSIVPNHALGGNINMPIHIDARGATQDAVKMLPQAVQTAVQQAVAQVKDLKRRGKL